LPQLSGCTLELNRRPDGTLSYFDLNASSADLGNPIPKRGNQQKNEPSPKQGAASCPVVSHKYRYGATCEDDHANDSSRDLSRNFRTASLVCNANGVLGCQIAALDQRLAIVGSRHD
jgi:hypothetical protein